MPSNLRQILERADQAFRAGNYAYAIEMCLDALKMDAKCLEARKRLRAAQRKAWQERASGQGAALAAYLGALPALVRMKVSQLLRKPEPVLLQCEQVLTKLPSHRGALLAGGLAARATQDFPTALFFFETVLEAREKDPVAMRQVAEVRRESGDYKAALDAFERLKAGSAGDYGVDKEIRDLEAAVSMQEKWKPQSESFTEIVKDMDRQRDLDAEGQSIRSDEDLERAVERTRRNQEREPEEIRHPLALCDLLARKGDFAGAEEALRVAAGLNAADYRIEERRVRLSLEPLEVEFRRLARDSAAGPPERFQEIRLERARKGAEGYRRLVSFRPTDSTLRFRLGEFLVDLGETDGAIREFQSAEADPRLKRDALRRLGECWLEKGEHDLAAKTCQRALEGIHVYDEKDKEILYLLGRAYEAAGSRAQAVEIYMRLQEMDIGFRDVSKRVSVLRKKDARG